MLAWRRGGRLTCPHADGNVGLQLQLGSAAAAGGSPEAEPCQEQAGAQEQGAQPVKYALMIAGLFVVGVVVSLTGLLWAVRIMDEAETRGGGD